MISGFKFNVLEASLYRVIEKYGFKADLCCEEIKSAVQESFSPRDTNKYAIVGIHGVYKALENEN